MGVWMIESSKPVPIAILASGRGSNFDAIADAIESGHLDARITSVVSDRPEAPVLEKARARGLKVHSVPFAPATSSAGIEERRVRHDEEILRRISSETPRFLVMAGYMRIVSPLILEAFRSERGEYCRVVNVHPSLLPAFSGTSGYAQAFEHGCQVAGVTVHLVDQGLDSGPICAQEAFGISDCRSAREVEARGLQIEHRLYPQTLSWILPEKFEIETRSALAPPRRPCVRPN